MSSVLPNQHSREINFCPLREDCPTFQTAKSRQSQVSRWAVKHLEEISHTPWMQPCRYGESCWDLQNYEDQRFPGDEKERLRIIAHAHVYSHSSDDKNIIPSKESTVSEKVNDIAQKGCPFGEDCPSLRNARDSIATRLDRRHLCDERYHQNEQKSFVRKEQVIKKGLRTAKIENTLELQEKRKELLKGFLEHRRWGKEALDSRRLTDAHHNLQEANKLLFQAIKDRIISFRAGIQLWMESYPCGYFKCVFVPEEEPKIEGPKIKGYTYDVSSIPQQLLNAYYFTLKESLVDPSEQGRSPEEFPELIRHVFKDIKECIGTIIIQNKEERASRTGRRIPIESLFDDGKVLSKVNGTDYGTVLIVKDDEGEHVDLNKLFEDFSRNFDDQKFIEEGVVSYKTRDGIVQGKYPLGKDNPLSELETKKLDLDGGLLMRQRWAEKCVSHQDFNTAHWHVNAANELLHYAYRDGLINWEEAGQLWREQQYGSFKDQPESTNPKEQKYRNLVDSIQDTFEKPTEQSGLLGYTKP